MRKTEKSDKWTGFHRLLAALMAAVLVCGSVGFTGAGVVYAVTPDGTAEEAEIETAGNVITAEKTYKPDADALADSEELFSEYVDHVFYGDDDISTLANIADTYFAGDEKALTIYYLAKEMIAEVADGKRESSIFDADTDGLTWTAEELGTNVIDEAVSEIFDVLIDVLDCLMADCPYELYWYDKTEGCLLGFNAEIDPDDESDDESDESETTFNVFEVVEIQIYFTVASGYQGDDEYTVDTEKTSAASESASNAKEIAAKYDSLSSDWEKAEAYKNVICALTSYNFAAAEDEDMPYGDPWQLIYVFDEDPETEVVCEGYSKAFKYLCDLGMSEDAACYTVTGVKLYGDGTGGLHMWNILQLDGRNYCVDVTSTDERATATDGSLFLVDDINAVLSVEGLEYTFGIPVPLMTATYIYDYDTIRLYGSSILALGGSTHVMSASEQPAGQTTLTYGDSESTLSFTAEAENGTISYQWYELSYNEDDELIFTPVEGAEGADFTIPDRLAAGSRTLYSCIATHHQEDSDAEYKIVSDVAAVTVEPKTLTPSVSGTASKVYDGTTDVSGLSITLEGVRPGDTVTATADFSYESAEIGTDIPIQVTDITLEGEDASNYILSTTMLSTTGTITEAETESGTETESGLPVDQTPGDSDGGGSSDPGSTSDSDSGDAGTVKTGDTNNPGLWLLLMAAACMGIAGGLVVKKRK